MRNKYYVMIFPDIQTQTFFFLKTKRNSIFLDLIMRIIIKTKIATKICLMYNAVY